MGPDEDRVSVALGLMASCQSWGSHDRNVSFVSVVNVDISCRTEMHSVDLCNLTETQEKHNIFVEAQTEFELVSSPSLRVGFSKEMQQRWKGDS